MAVNLVKNNLDGSPAVASPPSASDWVAPGPAVAGSKNLQGAVTIAVPINVATDATQDIPFSLAFKARILFATHAYSATGNNADTFTWKNAAGLTIASVAGSGAVAGKVQYSGVGLSGNAVVAAGEALTLSIVDGGGDVRGVSVLHCIPEP